MSTGAPRPDPVRTGFDLRDPAVRADPYPFYARQRSLDPVLHLPSAGLWFVLGHDDCVRVLQDPGCSAEQGQRLRARHGELPPSMLSADPPEHARLRRDLAPIFAPSAVRARQAALRRLVRRQVEQALLAGEGPVDLVEGFARPLSAAVLAEVIGLGDEAAELLQRRGPAASRHLDPFAVEDDDAAAATSAILELAADRLHATSSPGPHRDEPRAVDALAGGWRAGRLSPGECLAAVALLVVGGLEPLADALVGVLARACVADSPVDSPADSVPSGPRLVEEVLRHDSPIQFTARRATCAVRVGRHDVPAGGGLVVVLAAANRDPDRFPGAETLVPGRSPNPHLAFGAGPHVCLGAALVRSVLTLTVEQLQQHGVGLEPAGQPVRRPAAVPRGYLHYPVRVSSSSA